ncbi:hypothetical protein TNCV_2121411 [Trichonephila clavipes]|nr:hypothetical protein TNCV_2121411 [Trichonephila clavipes]
MLRDDSIGGALQPPYSGPYCILQRIGKVFVLRIGTKEVRVSVDRMKTAYVLANDPSSIGLSLQTPGSARPTVTTLSGRRVHFTDFLSSLNYFSPQGDYMAPSLLFNNYLQVAPPHYK